jgi:NAD(P)-dependent dehydrogenase (short-subunit alcohol dehydrogenase family)
MQTLPNGQQWSMDEGPEHIPALYPRYSKPEEIAATIAFLLSDEAKMITKQEWYVDGVWNESTFIPQ